MAVEHWQQIHGDGLAGVGAQNHRRCLLCRCRCERVGVEHPRTLAGMRLRGKTALRTPAAEGYCLSPRLTGPGQRLCDEHKWHAGDQRRHMERAALPLLCRAAHVPA